MSTRSFSSPSKPPFYSRSVRISGIFMAAQFLIILLLISHTSGKDVKKDLHPTRKERNAALDYRAVAETARLQDLMKEAALLTPAQSRIRGGPNGPVVGDGVMTREQLAASILRARGQQAGQQRGSQGAENNRAAQPQHQPFSVMYDPAGTVGVNRQGAGTAEGGGGEGGSYQPYGGAEDPGTPADFEANFGRGVEEGDSQYFMYAHSPRQNEYEFGFRKGTEDHFHERYEKAGPNANFKTKVRWGDKNGGYGEHYWDFNHAGGGGGGAAEGGAGGAGGATATGTGTGGGAAPAYGGGAYGRDAGGGEGAPAAGVPTGTGAGLQPQYAGFVSQGSSLNSQTGGAPAVAGVLQTMPGPNLGPATGGGHNSGREPEAGTAAPEGQAGGSPAPGRNPGGNRNRNNRRGRNGRRNRNRNRARGRGRNNRQRGNPNQQAAITDAPLATAPANPGAASFGGAGAGSGSLTGNNDGAGGPPENNFRRFFRWPFQSLPVIGRSDAETQAFGPRTGRLDPNWPFSRRAGTGNTPAPKFHDPRKLALNHAENKLEEESPEEEEESEDEDEESEPEENVIPTTPNTGNLQLNPVDARVKVTSTPNNLRLPSSVRNPLLNSLRRPTPAMDPTAITKNPEKLETLSITELESLLQKLTRIPKDKPDQSASTQSNRIRSNSTSRFSSNRISSERLPMEPRDVNSKNTTFPAEEVLAKYPIAPGDVKLTNKQSSEADKKDKKSKDKSKSEELFGNNNPFLAFDVESGKVYEQKTGRVFRLTPVSTVQ